MILCNLRLSRRFELPPPIVELQVGHYQQQVSGRVHACEHLDHVVGDTVAKHSAHCLDHLIMPRIGITHCPLERRIADAVGHQFVAQPAKLFGRDRRLLGNQSQPPRRKQIEGIGAEIVPEGHTGRNGQH